MATITLSPDTRQQQTATKPCRFCGANLRRTFVDLGMSPLCETYPSPADLNRGEVYYPLHVYVCEQCFLVQLEQYESPENIFSHYAYYSSYSDSWLYSAPSDLGGRRYLPRAAPLVPGHCQRLSVVPTACGRCARGASSSIVLLSVSESAAGIKG